jgi:hypothetical protein
MMDVAIDLADRPGSLAALGEALGRAGVSIEGGGAFAIEASDASVPNARGVAHFLFEDGAAARSALEAAGIKVVAVRDVVTHRLNQARPGQLGRVTRALAKAGVNIEVLYSDHDNQLILVVDDAAVARAVLADPELRGLG